MLGTAISFASAMMGGLLGATCMMLYSKNTEYKLRKRNEYLREKLRFEEAKTDSLRRKLQSQQMFSQTAVTPKASQSGAPKLGNGSRTSLEGGEWKDA